MRKHTVVVILAGVALGALLVWHLGLVSALTNRVISAQETKSVLPADFTGVALPFTLANGHIFVTANVDGTPLQFCIDTGNKFTIIDLDRARELHLSLRGDIEVKGNGAQSTHGAFVKQGSVTLVGFPGFSEGISLAIPLNQLSSRLGQHLDGLLGSDFFSRFIVEIDYAKKTVTLHNKDTFHYAGKGESIPIYLTGNGHPVVAAAIRPSSADAEIPVNIELDIGANSGLQLNTPFVAEHHLPPAGSVTVPDIGGAGIGGEMRGDTGRVSTLRIGTLTLHDPITSFSRDTGGGTAASVTQGSFGEVISSRFRLILDYTHKQIIFEPAANFGEPFHHSFSGLAVEAGGPSLRTFSVFGVAPGSPAASAGFRAGDILVSLNGRPTSEMSFEQVLEGLREPTKSVVTVQRSGQNLSIDLVPTSLL